LSKLGGLSGRLGKKEVRVVPRGALVALLCIAVLLPIAIVLAMGTSLLFTGLNDAPVARVMNGVALALGLLWLLSLIALTLALSLDAASRGNTARGEQLDEERSGTDER
jgi:hypothetical protein